MEQIECSETSAYKIQTPGNHPEENIQHTEHGESLKSGVSCWLYNRNSQLSVACHFMLNMQSGSALQSHNRLTHVAASSRGTRRHAVGCCNTDSCRRPNGTQSQLFARMYCEGHRLFSVPCMTYSNVRQRKMVRPFPCLPEWMLRSCSWSVSPLRPSGYHTDHSDCIPTTV
jgi:hypothetical protein